MQGRAVRSLGSRKAVAMAAAGLILWSATSAAGRAAENDPDVQTFRSSSGITTKITRRTQGELSERDREHAATLSINALYYIRAAHTAVDANDSKLASAEINKALEILAIVHRLLPKTSITTRVTDSDGQVLHEDSRELELAAVPLEDVATVIDLLRPLRPASGQAKAGGVELAESDLVETVMTMNLGFVERRVREAQQYVNSDLDRAEDALELALLDGMVVTSARSESPLLEVRDALWYATAPSACSGMMKRRPI